MTTPQESPDAEITPGDVTENPSDTEEDASNPHVDEDETLTSEGTDTERPAADKDAGDESFDSTEDSD